MRRTRLTGRGLSDMRTIYTACGRRRSPAHPLVTRCEPPARIDAPDPLPYKPRKIAMPARSQRGFERRTAISAEQTREADLSTEQARAQASPRFSRAHGHQGWAQGAVGTALARTQAPVRLRTAPDRIARFDGTTEATGRLFSCGVRTKGCCARFPVAGAQAGRHRTGPLRLYRFEESRQRRRTQPRPPASARAGAALRREPDARGPRLRAGRAPGRPKCAVCAHDAGL